MPTMTSRKSHTNGSGPDAVNGTGMRIDAHLMAKMRRAGFHLHAAGYTTPERVEALSNDDLEAVPHCGGRSLKIIRYAVATRNPVLLPALFPDERAARIWRAKVEGGHKSWAGQSKEQRREALRARGVLWTSETAAQAKNGHAPAEPVAVEPEAAPIDTEVVAPAPAPAALRVVDLVQVARDLVTADDAIGAAERALVEETAGYERALRALAQDHEQALAAHGARLDRARQDRDAAVALLAEAARAVPAEAA